MYGLEEANSKGNCSHELEMKRRMMTDVHKKVCYAGVENGL